jgi:ribosomal protein S21
VADGDVAGALKILKRRLDDTGLLRLLRPNSTLLAYYSKGQKRRLKRAAAARRRIRAASRRTGHIGRAEQRRIKSLRARKRQRKAARRDRAHTAMLDRLGLDDRPRRRAAP